MSEWLVLRPGEPDPNDVLKFPGVDWRIWFRDDSGELIPWLKCNEGELLGMLTAINSKMWEAINSNMGEENAAK